MIGALLRRRSTEPGRAYELAIDGVSIEVTRKRVKHVRFAVYRTDGRVRVTAPLRLAEHVLQEAIRERLPWIHAKREAFAAYTAPPPLRYISGETHMVEGRECVLDVIAHDGRTRVTLVGSVIEMRIAPSATMADRRRALYAWHRVQLKAQVPALLAHWEATIGVHAAEWSIKHMKTKWGTCNTRARRIWLNLELARKSARAVEYIIVHELVHLLERHHNARFREFMDAFLPDWRIRSAELE